jgi:hypothetical protein
MWNSFPYLEDCGKASPSLQRAEQVSAPSRDAEHGQAHGVAHLVEVVWSAGH